MRAKTTDAASGDALFREKVKRIIGERIRPALRLHEGDIRVKEVRGGEVWVVFEGACKSCPSAQITMEEIVEQALSEELGNELAGVHLVNETDEDLLDFARRLLKKG